MSEEKNSVFRRNSRYVSGGATEVGDNRLEWWERNTFAADPAGDTLYTVDQITTGRLDLIASMFLGEPRFWWLIAQYNSILDPFAEVVTGAQIYIPSPERVDAMLNGRVGGKPSTREVPISILPLV